MKTTNIAKHELDKNAPAYLRRVYGAVQKNLIGEMDLADAITHDGTKGQVGEEHWIRVLSAYLPDRFRVQSGIVMDSQGRTSGQIDIVIHDRHFTPPLLGQESHAYILAEAVYAVFEVKQSLDKEMLSYAADKVASVRALMRTSVPMVNSGRVMPARAPFPIIGGILARRAGWADGLGNVFRGHLDALEGDALRRIDCGCALEHGCFDRFPTRPPSAADVGQDGLEDDRALAVRNADAGLIYFLFRLLGQLNRLGTVPAVDWYAYAGIFEDGAGGEA